MSGRERLTGRPGPGPWIADVAGDLESWEKTRLVDFGTLPPGSPPSRPPPATPPTPEGLSEEAREVALQVHTAQERAEERDLVAAAQEAVERLSRRYRELCASLPEPQRMQVERSLGRRVTDVRRLASALPRVAREARESTPDRQVAGASEVGERRITGVSWTSDAGTPGPTSGSRVGGEVDAWCGKCGRATTHQIVALLGGEPKKVLCVVCGGRHDYRTAPARPAAAPPGETRPATSALDPEAARRAEQQRALSREVAEAQDVRTFDPKGRYRPGDIIAHPQFGRGKVENVLRSSLLVRFSVGGLKSIMLG